MKSSYTITNAIAAALTRIERARGFLEAAALSEDWIRAISERALVLEAHHTTHIEGTQLNLSQAERLLKGEAVPEADPDDVRELLNYRRAFELVSEYLDSGSPITEGVIRDPRSGNPACGSARARRAGDPTGRPGKRASTFRTPGKNPRRSSGARQSHDSGFRAPLARGQPPHASAGSEETG